MEILVTFEPFTHTREGSFSATTAEEGALRIAYEAAQQAAGDREVWADTVELWIEGSGWTEVSWGAHSQPEFFEELSDEAARAGIDGDLLQAYVRCFDEPDSHYVDSPSAFIQDIVDRHYGQFDSERALGESVLDATGALGGLPANLEAYIDFESYGRDLVLGGDFTIDDQTGHTFINN